MSEIKRFYSLLRSNGFEIVDHLKSLGTDHSDIKNFRDKKVLCSRIVEHDPEYKKKLISYHFILYLSITIS